MIYCLNLNPCVDINIVDGKESVCLAGKGLNVCRFLRKMGLDVTLAGFMPKDDENAFCSHLEDLNIPYKFFLSDGSARRNIKTIQNGSLVEKNQGGFFANAESQKKLLDYLKNLKDFDAIALCGSLPLRCAKDFYLRIINVLQEGIPIFLDTSKEALRHSVCHRVTLIKPNKDEIEELTGVKIKGLDGAREAVKKAYDLGCKNVLLSLGELGGVFYDGKNMWRAGADARCLNPVGAGDCMLASCINGFIRNDTPAQILKNSVAWATYKIQTQNAMEFDIEKAETFFEKVFVKEF